jgi:hypothetical protein
LPTPGSINNCGLGVELSISPLGTISIWKLLSMLPRALVREARLLIPRSIIAILKKIPYLEN